MSLSRAAKKFAWLTSHPEWRAHPLRFPIRILRWEWHRIRGTHAVLPLAGFLIQARPSDGMGRLICYFRDGADELFAFMKRYLKTGMTFVDVGANIGSHTVHGARLVASSGRVFSFEADPETFELLRDNVKLNSIENATLYSQCVADKEGTVMFNISANSARSSLLRKGPSQRTLVANTLDNLLPPETQVDLLKIDVEGADYLVLHGAKRIFATKPPSVVVIEVTHREIEIKEFLQSRGYRLYRFDHGTSTLAEVELPVFNTYALRDCIRHELSKLEFRWC
jgi:FkbM family methyltransferase